jgi:PilZ domain
MERRLPIIVVLRLAPMVSASTDGERTFTDNISAHGARIFSNRAWQPGDAVRVTPLNEDSVWAQVVYSERLPNNRYAIGVKFQDGPIPWSVMRRYDGL